MSRIYTCPTDLSRLDDLYKTPSDPALPAPTLKLATGSRASIMDRPPRPLQVSDEEAATDFGEDDHLPTAVRLQDEFDNMALNR